MQPDVTMKALGMTVKALETDAADPNGQFEAILSTSALDRQGEQVMPGAFEPLPASLPLFSNHAWMKGSNPIGEGVPRYEDGVLKLKGRWAPTAEAQETRVLVAGGFIKAMSAGYLEKLRDPRDPRKILKAELIEASTASIPVNPEALFAMAKSLGGVNLAPLDAKRRLVVRAKATPSGEDRELAALRSSVAKSLVRAGIDPAAVELEAIRAKIDAAVVDAGADRRSSDAAQAAWLNAYGRELRRQLLAAA